jgi:hypothetical protein
VSKRNAKSRVVQYRPRAVHEALAPVEAALRLVNKPYNDLLRALDLVPCVIEQTSPETCLPVTSAHKNGPADLKALDGHEPQAGEQPEYVFRRDGDGWFIKAFGERGHFPGLVGLERLARLVKAAGRPVPMTELVSGGDPKKRVSATEAAAAGLASDGTSFEPLVDEQAVEALKKEIKETAVAICQAEKVGDVTQAEIYRNQLAKLEGQYKAVTRPGGKPRKFRTEIDRLRPAIHQSISRACQRLRKAGMKNTAAHFEVSYRAEGNGFIYSPSPPIRWQ